MLRDYRDRPDEEKVNRLAEANVLEQIANLKTHPSVASRLAAGEVMIRGWVYDIGSGSIRQADPDTGEFAPFTGECHPVQDGAEFWALRAPCLIRQVIPWENLC